MPLTLTPRQLEALPTLDWLYSEANESRGTGRSTLMAVVLIRLACRNPRIYITPRDHFDTRDMSRHLLRVIEGLVSEDVRVSPYFQVSNRRIPEQFQLDLPEPIEDWLPLSALVEGPRVTSPEPGLQPMSLFFNPARAPSADRPTTVAPQGPMGRRDGMLFYPADVTARVQELVSMGAIVRGEYPENHVVTSEALNVAYENLEHIQANLIAALGVPSDIFREPQPEPLSLLDRLLRDEDIL